MDCGLLKLFIFSANKTKRPMTRLEPWDVCVSSPPPELLGEENTGESGCGKWHYRAIWLLRRLQQGQQRRSRDFLNGRIRAEPPEGEGQQRGWGEFEAERELDAPRGDNLPRIGKEAK
jgi:hypothetical protein